MTAPTTLTERTANRTLADRRNRYLDEIGAIIDATYSVIERTGSVDPTIRDILAEAGLSTQGFYRHFKSKDELFLVILDDGRQSLADYLEHQMAKVADPDEKVRAWVAGVLAQAADRDAARRTRPFLVNHGKLVDRFPDEQQASVALFVEQLAAVMAVRDASLEALAVYQLAFGVMEWHVLNRTEPDPAQISYLTEFATRSST
jgi:AcrR family transcriptional regulator